jgi:hypothetical protein
LTSDFEAVGIDGPDVTYVGDFEYLGDKQNLGQYIPISVVRQGRKREWDMEEILYLLNSLGDEWHKRRTARSFEHSRDYFTVTFVKNVPSNGDLNQPVPALHISCPLWTETAPIDESGYRFPPPKVEISLKWVCDDVQGQPIQHDPNDNDLLMARDGQFWSLRVRRQEVSYDTRHRQMSPGYTRIADQAYIEGHFPVRESSKWIRHTDMMLIHERTDFSRALDYFIWKYPSEFVWGTADEYVFNRFSAVLSRRSNTLWKPRPDHTAKAFLARPGWVELRLVPPRDGDGLERITLEDGRVFSVVSGYWIHPRAPAIMQENPIDGLIMDTTFKVIRQYHTAALVAVSHNVGIPLGIAFGPKESLELYDRFYTFFDEHGVDLRQYILESDQGAALMSIGQRHPRHLLCLHHVLRSFGKECGRFGPLVGNLIRARSQKELEVFIAVYVPDFLQVCENHGREEAQLRLALGKAGLVMREDRIDYEDPQETRWRQVSMLARLDTNMPSTSNTIECLNGHMNESTPRNNTFWGSLHRISDIFDSKIRNFVQCVRHNHRHQRRRVWKRVRALPTDRMLREIDYFESRPEFCSCGETRFACRMYRVDVPCSHRVFLLEQRPLPDRPLAVRPGLEEPELQVGPLRGDPPVELTRCQINYDVFATEVDEQNDLRNKEVDWLVHLIVRDARAQKRRDEVREFVERFLPEASCTQFALQESNGFWEVHNQGIAHFWGVRRVQRRGGDSDDDDYEEDDDDYTAPRSRARALPPLQVSIQSRRSQPKD